jgi:hypothetical protein
LKFFASGYWLLASGPKTQVRGQRLDARRYMIVSRDSKLHRTAKERDYVLAAEGQEPAASSLIAEKRVLIPDMT